jgi:hypothetical protein
MVDPKTLRFNVTDLTPEQQRVLFLECISQAGFIAFEKTQRNQQTHYTFKYKN